MTEPLIEIVNALVKNGTFPSCLKKFVVKPIWEKKPVHEVNHSHPVILVSSLFKVLENVSNQLVTLLDKHNIHSNLQFRFRKFKSTKMQ
jgi:hypothetical protein